MKGFGESKNNINKGFSNLIEREISKKAIKFFKTGNFAESEKLFELYISKGFNDPEIFLHYSNLCEKLNKNNKAENLLKIALQRKPTYLKAINNLVHILKKKGNLEEAKKIIKEKIAIIPNQSILYANLCKINLQEKNFNQAEKLISKAIELKPKQINYYLILADIYNKKKKHEKVEFILKKAIEIDPNNPTIFLKLANLYRYLNKDEIAELNYKKAIKIKPNFIDGQLILCNFYIEKNKSSEARMILENINFSNKNSGKILFEIGNLYRNIQLPKISEKYFRKALIMEPNNIDILNNLAIVLQELGNSLEAESLIRKAIQIDPTFFNGYLNLSKIKREQLLINESLEIIKIALKLRPWSIKASNELNHDLRIISHS